MPTWGEILEELKDTRSPQGPPDYDAVRRKYLQQLAAFTGRSTILYASDFLGSNPNPNVGITLADMQALMEVMKGLPGPDLDLILHTPGGSAEAVESLVRYLRTKFEHMRVFVPLAAMSAGTMWALAADQVVMGKHSQLGPIDPQFPLAFGEQIRFTPAQAVLDQFEYAKHECQNPANLPAWITVLRSYGPSLLEECRRAQALSESLVSCWLEEHMFRGQPDAAKAAKDAAHSFADYQTHYSHGRGISRDGARGYGVKVVDLEDDEALQDAVLSVHHATMHTLNGTGAVKIVENSRGKTYAILGGVVPRAPEGKAPGAGKSRQKPGGRRRPK